VFAGANWVWSNGELVPWASATLHVSSHALHYGTGVFEGMRCYETAAGPALFRADAHFDRFFASAGVYGQQIPYSAHELLDAAGALIRANEFGACYIRPICYYGSAALGLVPDACPVQVAMLAWPWKNLHTGDPRDTGVSVGFSRWQKFSSAMMPATAKACGQYVNSVLAVREAKAAGFDDAILLDAEGNVCEGSGENIFVVKDGVLYTNDERHSILMGITRDSVITIARDAGLTLKTRALTVEDLATADEIFLTGTAIEVVHVRALDGKAVAAGNKGPVTSLLQQKYFDAVYGRSESYAQWLTRVDASPRDVEPEPQRRPARAVRTIYGVVAST
jgi:branched-chain amino acid aminotransferase